MINKIPIRRHRFSSRKYLPVDNSYSFCYEDGRNYRLAGTHRPVKEAEVVEVIGTPFRRRERIGYHEFIKVRCKRGLTHRVLYYESRLLN